MCGSLACCGQPEYGMAARSHAHSGTLHVIFWKVKHLNMREAAGEDLGSVKLSKLPSACGSGWRYAGMIASVLVAQETISNVHIAKGARKQENTAMRQQASGNTGLAHAYSGARLFWCLPATRCEYSWKKIAKMRAARNVKSNTNRRTARTRVGSCDTRCTTRTAHRISAFSPTHLQLRVCPGTDCS